MRRFTEQKQKQQSDQRWQQLDCFGYKLLVKWANKQRLRLTS